MKGLVVPTIGDPVVVNGDWANDGVIVAVLGARFFEVLRVPGTTKPRLALHFDEEAKFHGRDVNRVATRLLADALQRGDYVAGPALILGAGRDGDYVELDLLDLIQLGARLVRAEREALTQPKEK